VEGTASGVGVHALLDELGIFNLVSGHCTERAENVRYNRWATKQGKQL
jgi:hypothetical protein